jgi:hypothetical protein
MNPVSVRRCSVEGTQRHIPPDKILRAAIKPNAEAKGGRSEQRKSQVILARYSSGSLFVGLWRRSNRPGFHK